MSEIVKISPEIDEVKLTKAEECHKEWLYDQYWNQGRTIASIAQECGVVPSTPWKWMKKFNIPIRPSRFTRGHKTNLGLKFSPEQIEARYYDENNPRWKGGQISYHRRKALRVWTKYWNENVPTGYYVHHIDCDVSNNNISNLALVTHSFHQTMHHNRRKNENNL